MELEKYGFEKMETEEVWRDLKQCCRYKKESLVVAEISGQLADELSGQILEEIQTRKNLLQLMDCHFLLLVWNAQDEIRLVFFSDTKRVRALEFLDYLISEFGLIKGNAGCASGQIASVILKVQMAGMDLNETMEYFLKMAASYFEDCDWIEVAEYAGEHQQDIRQMPRYTKKQTAWAYVKSTDAVAAGRQVCVKSLENESGVIVTAGEDIYIMIGCRGEIYDIGRGKFESTYEVTEEPLDVFEQMLDFLPEIETVPEGEYISLDEIAHLCYPKKGTGIYGCPLEKRTKVFPANGSEEYFLGRPGDYLAVRQDDTNDIYIIQKDVFTQTYEKAE